MEFCDRINCFVSSYDVVAFALCGDVAPYCDVARYDVARYGVGAEHGVVGGAWDNGAYKHDRDAEHKQRNDASDGKEHDVRDDRHGVGVEHNDVADDKLDEAVRNELELGRDAVALENERLVLR